MKESIFSEMSRLANHYNAINLSQGFPEYNPPGEMIDAIYEYMRKGFNQYAPMGGVPKLLNAINLYIKKKFDYDIPSLDCITITSGATQAIFTAINSLVESDDEVIFFAPAYDSYLPSILKAGGRPVCIHTHPPDFSIDWDEVKKKISKKTKVILINTPHNPGTFVFTPEDFTHLIEIVDNTKIIVISDEVYDNLCYTTAGHLSVLSFPELRERAVVIFSAGKLFNATGWKVGWAIAPLHISLKIRELHQFIVFCVNPAIQNVIADFLNNFSILEEIRNIHVELRDYTLNLLKYTPLKAYIPSGTYFILIDYSQVSKMRDYDFAIKLVKEFRVATIPLSPFYPDNNSYTFLRLCFSKKKETLMAGIENLKKACFSLS